MHCNISKSSQPIKAFEETHYAFSFLSSVLYIVSCARKSEKVRKAKVWSRTTIAPLSHRNAAHALRLEWGLVGKEMKMRLGDRRRWKNIKTKAVSRTREKKDQWEVKNGGRGKRKLR